MRRIVLLILLFMTVLPSWGVQFSAEAKRTNLVVDSTTRKVTLVMCIDHDHYSIPFDSIQAVYAWGSMSDYHDAIAECQMTDFSEDSCFYRIFSYDEIAIPGNSGQPEFEFYTQLLGDSVVYYTPDMMRTPYDEQMFWNGLTPVLITLPGGPSYMTTDWNELRARRDSAKVIRPVVDFDLTNSIQRQQISNFRALPGITGLYRSYHPFYPSLFRYDTEAARIRIVDELAEEVGIKSIISLSGNQSSFVGQKYVCDEDTFTISIPDYYQHAMSSGNVLYIGVSDSRCYYHSENAEVAGWIEQVVKWIADETHPLPMQIHCAIGADRTGFMCAMIEILCEVPWNDVMDDYRASSNMLVQTYRHPNKLRYAIEKMLGVQPDLVSTSQLSSSLRSYLILHSGLTADDIDTMINRLRSSTSIESADISDNNCVYYDLLGRPVGKEYHGIVVTSSGMKIFLPRTSQY